MKLIWKFLGVVETARCDHQRTLQKTEFKTPNNTHTQNNLSKPTIVSTTPRNTLNLPVEITCLFTIVSLLSLL